MTTREYAKNLFSQWSDRDFCNQPVFDKLLWQVLNGQRGVNTAGVFPINFTRWCNAMRDGDNPASEAQVREALARMEARRYVYIDEETGEGLIRTRVRNDDLERQPSVLLAALKIMCGFDSPKFAHVMLAELAQITIPVIDSDKPYGKKLQADLVAYYTLAQQHLKRVAEGFEPAQLVIPNPQENHPPHHPANQGPDHPPLDPPATWGNAEPANTTQGPSQGPSISVSGSVSGSLTSKGGHLGGGAESSSQPTANTPAPDSGDEPRARSSKPGDPEPPSRCVRHRDQPADDTAPACRPCAAFRQAHERWTERQRRRDLTADSEATYQRAAAAAEAIANCRLCDPDGYLPNRAVCTHDPGQADTNARGIARARAALAAKTTPDPDETAEEPSDVA
ncbi:hypothetical protein [Mycolicibacterium mucogenicum]|uniref:Uncharacterized protein n=1 Tax=Mycolicibacterium mucogenicum DSM 44124 TaxID=1226753 RepID=A0A8H2J8Y5_MYCMU|nr:hypothetical protein [Mycolicibacterium mucogenicum]KAB7761199.1 hypothetical protein MMUC44124_01040 [Mycolicibacterium mucogenicum DSM 44124]QPG70014.1 hypothetical protein C1S78_003015 [Mycolicibacterium mucogenicum DSM 44124]